MTTNNQKIEAAKRAIAEELKKKEIDSEKTKGAIKTLIDNGVDPNTSIVPDANEPNKKVALLMVATISADVESVKQLIAKGAIVNDKMIANVNALATKYPQQKEYQTIRDVLVSVKTIAEELKKKEIDSEKTKGAIKTLIDNGVDPNTSIVPDANEPNKKVALLMVATISADVESVKQLIAKGAIVNDKMIANAKRGETPECKAVLAMLEEAYKKQISKNELVAQLTALAIDTEGNKKELGDEAKTDSPISKLNTVLKEASIEVVDEDKVIELAIKTGHYQVVELVINKMATDADEAKKKENAQALKTQALNKAKDLQNQWRTEKAVEGKDKKDIKTPYDALVKQLSGADEGDKENPAEKPDFARGQDVTLATWYLESAGQWQILHGKTYGSIANVPEEQRSEDQKNDALKAKQESEIAAAYTKLHELEAKLVNPNISADEKRKALEDLARTSSQLIGLLEGYYKDALTETAFKNQQKVLSQANWQYQSELSTLNQTQKPKEGGRSGGTPGGNTPPTAGTTDVTIPGQLPPQVTPTDLDEKTGVVTQATIDSVAHAKHDGSQEKSWWQRNQEWIWWTLGILVIAALTFFSFRKGGWFNKDDKKSSTVAVNTNTNQNTNQNTNTGNDNTNTDNSGTTNDSTNDTLANNSQLYSAKEINQAIAANRQNIGNQDR